jgi:MFS family permease
MKHAATSVETERAQGRPGAVAAAAAVGVLILSYCINAMDRTLFPLIITDVRNEYGFGLPEAGLLSTIFTLGMAVAGLPTGYLMSRYSRKTVMQIGMLIFSTGTVVTVLAVGFGDMLVYRALTGVGEAMQFTALLATFSSYFSRYRATGVGALNYAYAAGAIGGPALGTYLLVAFGTWRAPMIVFGLMGFVAMAAVAAVVARSLSDAAPRPEAKITSGGAPTLFNLNTAVLTFLSILFGLALYGYLGMYPTFLREQLHFAPTDVGRVLSTYGLGVLVSVGSGDRRPLPGSACDESQLPVGSDHLRAAVQRARELSTSSGVLLCARRRIQRHDLCQSRRISCEVRDRRSRRPRIGALHHQPLCRSDRCRLFDRLAGATGRLDRGRQRPARPALYRWRGRVAYAAAVAYGAA